MYGNVWSHMVTYGGLDTANRMPNSDRYRYSPTRAPMLDQISPRCEGRRCWHDSCISIVRARAGLGARAASFGVHYDACMVM